MKAFSSLVMRSCAATAAVAASSSRSLRASKKFIKFCIHGSFARFRNELNRSYRAGSEWHKWPLRKNGFIRDCLALKNCAVLPFSAANDLETENNCVSLAADSAVHGE